MRPAPPSHTSHTWLVSFKAKTKRRVTNLARQYGAARGAARRSPPGNNGFRAINPQYIMVSRSAVAKNLIRRGGYCALLYVYGTLLYGFKNDGRMPHRTP
jgi:hypothetical protein